MGSIFSTKWITEIARSSPAGAAITAVFTIAVLLSRPALAQNVATSIRSTPFPQAAQTSSAPAGAVVVLTPEFPRRILDALDFVDQGKYGDAIDIANDLCTADPDSPTARELRGAVELWVGDTRAAEADFEAAEQTDPGNPATHLGLADCAMRTNDPAVQDSTVLPELKRALSCDALTAAQSDDIATVEAYYHFVHGDSDAVRDLTPNTDPFRAELIAMAEVHTSASTGPADLAKFLGTTSGVPRVREDEGVRAIFTQRPAMLEPSITDPSIESMFANRITQPRVPEAGENTAVPVWGTITLAPTEPNPATSVVRYMVDGQTVATVTTRPYSFDWNTRLLLNGVHTVKLEARMEGGGIVAREVRQVKVDNGPDAIVGTNRANTDASTYAEIQGRLWSMLKPRPSRAVAELAMARLRTDAGDHADASTHTLIATALDPWLTSILHVGGGRLKTAEIASRHISATDGVWTGDTRRKWVCLTFDDGPNAKTAALLDALGRAHVHVTFFIVGSRAEERPDLIRRMAAAGHDVENHSYTHPNIAQCLPAMVESEILRTNIIIRNLTGRYPSYFRPPGGNASRTLAALADEFNLKLAFWSLDALKFEEESSKTNLVNYVVHHVHPGSIVLMHNGPDVTTAAIPDIVGGLRARGYQIVTLREIVAK